MNTVLEREFAQLMNVNRDEVIAIRDGELKKGVDWLRTGRGIELTPDGVAKLKERIGVGFDLGEMEVVEMVVERIPINPTVVLCLRAGEVELQTVRVKDSRKFVRGMMVLATRVKDRAGVWEHHGRWPRYRGRY